MEGQFLSHYLVEEKLGGGGMGVVYKALDQKLNRHVALKFLPPELTRNEEARERFVLEAQAASALDHPNICTIYEIDSTPDQQMFIAMGYYEGETLKKRIQRGPLPLEEALDIAIQLAQGLEEAHAADIVHRDIKPANVMLTKHGLVKIVDFGIAKLLGVTGPTRTGTTLGTVSYMAPEQVAGGSADQQSDIWALGAVLYEMLTGAQPFKGESQWVVMDAIRNRMPDSPSSLRAEVSAEVEQVVMRALEKARDARWASASDLLAALRSIHGDLTRSVPAPTQSRPAWSSSRVLVAATLLVSLAALGVWYLAGGTRAQWAREQAVPEIMRLIDANSYSAAFLLAEEARRHIPDDPIMADLWAQLSRNMSLATSPEGAELFYAPFTATGTPRWVSLGASPLSDIELPSGAFHLRVEKDGFEPIEALVADGSSTLEFTLDRIGALPPRMVRIPAGTLRISLAAFDDYPRQEAPSYLIDKFEVTNREFKVFVDAGAYERRDYWEEEFERDGRIVSWDEAMAAFRDRTGRAGPSTWEGGTYPQGQDDLPVSGVSWYEAAAYARFVGRALPTVYHWLGGTSTGAASFVLPLSNFGTGGLVATGNSLPGPFGTHDMAGNVREWCWNLLGRERYILGAAWDAPTYMFFEHEAMPPFDRSPTNGFRTADYLDASQDQLQPLALPIERVVRNYADEVPASDELFQAYAARFGYDSLPLNVTAGPIDESSEYWRKETVTFDAAYGGEQITADLFLPRDIDPPYQTVLYFPGSNTIRLSSRENRPVLFDYIVKSGRAVLYPVYKDTFERGTGLEFTDPTPSRSYVEHLTWWVKDVRRSLDYLESRSDIAHDKLAFFGFSWGARVGNFVLAVEPRFQVAVLRAGGFPLAQSLPEVKEINFAPRITVPVVMLNGEYDSVFPLETSQRPMFRFLGTPDEHKKHILYDGGHTISRPLRQDALDWLDKYLGPVR